ncbi:hypothetical protein PF010_g7023 [Phytophthora fragariae]|uniref:Uncharacterized protein n=1 Tax=Phytophthora fragariae TaxID=53985 RepID=A0A6A3TLS7_9STRA|nr:hypothetical protein PF003_g18716 [Phytophthora fragariae]KAE9078225.1 hypothetical protein PF006_g27759 [Phytophthora fragariae]KAE9121641.1 hypothetical protein PF010_g7023 [Phytophthora fragariae]KAE9136503.1 hypothetical protein PF007_g2180 [Phytophthora fragariae]KAE9328428.1 hypothetical protein PF001_g1420 [Phytophthora fragariae]
MTTATIREITGTIQKDNDTHHGSTQMYCPIYGEYYATVDADYAATTETWQVTYINDRRQTPLGLAYRVLCVHPDRSCKRLHRTPARLAEDDFEVVMDLDDRWKASKFDTFEEFWK